MTTADSILDEHRQRSDRDFALMYAEVLNQEARALDASFRGLTRP